MHSVDTGRRFDFELRTFTPKQRIKNHQRKLRESVNWLRHRINMGPEMFNSEEAWLKSICNGITELTQIVNGPIADTYSRQVEIPPIDKRYKDAPISEVYVSTDAPPNVLINLLPL